MKNNRLNYSKGAKLDEFYTRYQDIENEVLVYYRYNKDTFRNKVIFLPCDDPEKSNFVKFFINNFELLGVKEVIASSYDVSNNNISSQLNLLDRNFIPRRGKFCRITKNNLYNFKYNQLIPYTYLKGDGDFRSNEVTNLLLKSDIIITNPPFSLGRKFFSWVNNADKKFLFIANRSTFTYVNIFPLFKNNHFHFGALGWHPSLFFLIPDTYDLNNFNKASIKEFPEGIYIDAPANWITNIPHGITNPFLKLKTMEENLKYSDKYPQLYKKYLNYDAIEVPRSSLVPSNYHGVMGVPVSFMDKFNPDQFELIGLDKKGVSGIHSEAEAFKHFRWSNGNRASVTEKILGLNYSALLERFNFSKGCFTNYLGMDIQRTFSRLFIRHKKPLPGTT